jgi:hypothetical protein
VKRACLDERPDPIFCALAVICAKVLKAPEVSLLALLEVIFGILLAWMFAG